MRVFVTRVALLFGALAAACSGDEPAPSSSDGDGGAAPELCERVAALDSLAPASSYDYGWTCLGQVAPGGEPLSLTALDEDDCTTGIWPDLDDTVSVCPTVSAAVRTDPVSGKELPSEDARVLPIDIPVSESGSFLPSNLPTSFPETLRVVSWNMEYTAHLDEQIAILTTRPELASADVYLLSEVDRCSSRNGKTRGARRLAEALGAAYVYGIEFVELEIDRVAGGDTGQAILSRRPLSSAALTCHSNQSDWFATDDEPRLGERVFLHADIPVGDGFARVYAAHLESDDLFGEKRSAQAKELLDVAQTLACERPQIVAGDFNAPYCGAPELEVLRTSGFLDAVGLAGDKDPTHQSGFRLDYVWARGFRVVRGGVLRDVTASDHYPVWVDLEMDPNGA